MATCRYAILASANNWFYIEMFDPSRRRMLHALILSLLIHALILISVISVFPARVEIQPATIRAVFSADPARTAAVPAVAAVVPSTHDTPGKRSPPHLVAKSASVDLSPQPSREAPPQAAAESMAPSLPVSSETASRTPVASVDGVSANDLRQYRLVLAIAARRFKHYPGLARERGWEGTVELVLSIRSHLPEPEIILLRSSGYAALDRQAQDMMARAARTTELPEGLKGRDLRIVLPIQFSLEADQ